MNGRWFVNLMLLVPGTVWGISFIVVELILPYVEPITLTFIRTIISTIMLVSMLIWARSSLPNKAKDWWPFFILAFTNQAMPFALSSWQVYIEGSLASILLSVMPLFTVILAFFFTDDEKLSALKLFGVVLGLSGIALLFGPTAMTGLGSDFIAQLAVLGSALLYAIGAVFTRHIYRIQPSGFNPWQLRVRIMTAQFIAAGIMLAPFSFWLEDPLSIRPPFEVWLYLIFLGIGVTLFATMIYFFLIEQLGAGTASFTIYLIPVAGVIAGFFILDEAFTLLRGIALSLVLLGVFIASRVKT